MRRIHTVTHKRCRKLCHATLPLPCARSSSSLRAGLLKRDWALFGEELDTAIAALNTHSLRVGLTQDLFAIEDAGPIAQALRWTSTGTALRYGRKLAPSSNATARMLGKVRG